MARLKSNFLLPALVLVVLGAAGVIAYVSITGARPDYVLFQPRTTIEKPPHEPDADTPTDTIRRLQAEMNATNDHAQSLIKQNEKLQAEIAQLRGQENRIREEVRSQLREESKQARQADQQASRTQVDAISRELSDLRAQMTTRLPPVAMTPAPPDAGDLGGSYEWIQPLDTPDTKTGRAAAVRQAALTEPKFPGSVEPRAAAGVPSSGERVDQLRPPTPFFTVPALSSLVGSTTMTAMIGRIPRGGAVQDAVPFRVLVGRENLAASGLFVPDAVFGMVFEGTAIGDYALSCVYGNIDAATFVFQDGTIRSVDLGRQGNATGTGGGGAGSARDKRLAYVADRFGTPCVSGTRVGNTEEVLGLRIALTAAEAAAQAAAAAQTTTTTGAALGTSTTTVTGGLGPFIIGKTAADSMKEIDKYFQKRLDDIFEAVFVPAGQEVAIMVQQQITLDYEPDGRRLNHGVSTDRGRSHLD